MCRRTWGHGAVVRGSSTGVNEMIRAGGQSLSTLGPVEQSGCCELGMSVFHMPSGSWQAKHWSTRLVPISVSARRMCNAYNCHPPGASRVLWKGGWGRLSVAPSLSTSLRDGDSSATHHRSRVPSTLLLKIVSSLDDMRFRDNCSALEEPALVGWRLSPAGCSPDQAQADPLTGGGHWRIGTCRTSFLHLLCTHLATCWIL